MAPKKPQRLEQGGLDVIDNGIQAAARRLSHGQIDEDADEQTRHAERDECGSPCVCMRDGAGHIGAQPRADGGTERQHRHCHRSAVRRKAVRNDGRGRRRTARFAHPDADAAEQEFEIIARQPAQCGEAGPNDERCRQDVAAVRTVGQPRDRDSEGHVKERERNAGQECDAGIVQLQFEADRLEHRGDDVSVCNVDRIDQAHQNQNIPTLHRGGSAVAREIDCRAAQNDATSRVNCIPHHTGFATVTRRKAKVNRFRKMTWTNREMA